MPDNLEKIQWDSLSAEQQNEIVRGANTRIFWSQVGKRLAWLRGPMTFIVAAFALWSLFWEALAEQVQRYFQ